jgi:predicted MFS family arabinose efflux permease
VAAVLLVRLADEAAFFLPSAALESFRADLGLTYAQAGTVLALVAPGALFGTVFAVAADRGSRRAIASGGTFAFAACMAAFASGASFAVLAVAAFAMGAASTAMVDAAEVALVDLAGDDLRPALARANLLATIGDVLGPALVAAVALVGLSWRAAFWVAAVALAAYGVVLAAADLPGPTRGADEDGERPSSLRVLQIGRAHV